MVEQTSTKDSHFFYEKFEKEVLTKPSKYQKKSEKIERSKKVIIDCDPGGDDAQAIMLALHLGKLYDIEILGITCVAGNGSLDDVVHSAQLTMHVCGQPEIPIHRGEEPSVRGNSMSDQFWGPDGFGGTLNEFKSQLKAGDIQLNNVKEETAVDYLIRVSKEIPNEITILALAPMSNLAAATRKDPEFPSRIKNVVMMGGTYLGQGNSDYYCSEFNIFKDAEGAALVFDTFKDITMLPVEATFFQRQIPREINIKPYI